MEQWETAIDALKTAYRTWDKTKGKSIDTWLDFIRYPCDFRSLANGLRGLPWTKTHMTRVGVRSYLGGLTGDFTMRWFKVDRYICQGDTIVAIGATEWRNNATGIVGKTPKVDVWRVKDGKAVAFFEYYDTHLLHSMTVPKKLTKSSMGTTKRAPAAVKRKR